MLNLNMRNLKLFVSHRFLHSLVEMKTLKTLKEATKFFMGIADLINTIRSLSKFVVARVQGKVVGGGVVFLM